MTALIIHDVLNLHSIQHQLDHTVVYITVYCTADAWLVGHMTATQLRGLWERLFDSPLTPSPCIANPIPAIELHHVHSHSHRILGGNGK